MILAQECGRKTQYSSSFSIAAVRWCAIVSDSRPASADQMQAANSIVSWSQARGVRAREFAGVNLYEPDACRT